MKKVILTGDRPTGRLHVGHYAGSLKERVKLQNSGEYDDIYIMIADAQALTDNAEHPEKVRQNILQARLPCLRNRSEQVNNFCSVNDSRAYGAYFLLYEPRNRVPCSAQPHR